MWKQILASLLLAPSLANAAIFDSADILPKNSGAGGVMGEILLADPTSEGVELHGRYGLTDDWNVKGIIGFGSKTKRFRIGGEGVYSIVPDYEGQVGFSVLGSAIFLDRGEGLGGGLQLRVAPMVHKKVMSWADLPVNLYAALPLYFEGRQGRYTTGSQLALGALWDLSDAGRTYVSSEVGIRLAKAESYLLLGFGVRIGELKFVRRGSSGGSAPTPPPSGQRDFNDADFR